MIPRINIYSVSVMFLLLLPVQPSANEQNFYLDDYLRTVLSDAQDLWAIEHLTINSFGKTTKGAACAQ